MIVVEGPDGSGKTTLANKLCELYDLEYRRPPKAVLSSSDGPSSSGRELIDWWREELQKCRDKTYAVGGVYDRITYISDPIYRLAIGGHPQGTPDDMREGVHRLKNYARLIVFCLPEFEVTVTNVHIDDRPAFVIDREKLYNIWWAYHYLYELYKDDGYEYVARYDFTHEGDWWRIKNFVGQNILGLSIDATIGKG